MSNANAEPPPEQETAGAGAPSYSEDAEQAVLSAMLMDPDAVVIAREIVDDRMFYQGRHQQIFRAMLALMDRGDVIDPITLSEELARSSSLDSIGVKDYIGFLTDIVPTAANVEHHAKIVLNAAKSRELLRCLAENAAALRKPGAVADDVAGRVRAALAALPASKPRLQVLSDREILARPSPTQNIEGVFLAASTAAIVGPPGSGKGLVIMDMLNRAARGMPYHGHTTKRGTAVYVAMERQQGLPGRQRAWIEYHGLYVSAPIFFIPQKFSLYEREGAQLLLDALEALPQPVRIVAIDTAAKAMLPGDENSTHDMGLLMENLQLVAASGPTLVAVHHLNAAETRERGNSSFRGDVDTLIMLKPKDGLIKLVCDKQNEMEQFRPISLSIRQAADSALVITPDLASGVISQVLTPGQSEILESLRTVALTSSGASATEWKEASGKPSATFYEGRKALLDKGYVAQLGIGTRPRYILEPSHFGSDTPDSGNTPDSLRTEHRTTTLRSYGGAYKAPVAGVSAPELSLEDRGEAWEPD